MDRAPKGGGVLVGLLSSIMMATVDVMAGRVGDLRVHRFADSVQLREGTQPVSVDGPLYLQIRAELKERIDSGAFKAGQQLPTEQALADHYLVTRTTVREAFRELVADGLVERVQGKGTFVTSSRQQRKINRLSGITEDMGDRDLRTTTLRREWLPCPDDIAQRLELKEGSSGLYLVRKRVVDGRPFAVQHVWLPDWVGQRLSDDDLNDRSLYALMERRGVWLRNARQSVSVGIADVELAEHLELDRGDPLLRTERLTFDFAWRPVEFACTYSPPDTELTVELKR